MRQLSLLLMEDPCATFDNIEIYQIIDIIYIS